MLLKNCMISRNSPDGIIAKKTLFEEISQTIHLYANNTIYKGIMVRGRRENKCEIMSENHKIVVDYLHGLRTNVAAVVNKRTNHSQITKVSQWGLNFTQFRTQTCANNDQKQDFTLSTLGISSKDMFKYQFNLTSQASKHFANSTYRDLTTATLPPLDERYLTNPPNCDSRNPFREAMLKQKEDFHMLYPPANIINCSYYYGFVRYADNSAYCGMLCFGRRHGPGVAYSPDGFLEFIGYFDNDQLLSGTYCQHFTPDNVYSVMQVHEYHPNITRVVEIQETQIYYQNEAYSGANLLMRKDVVFCGPSISPLQDNQTDYLAYCSLTKQEPRIPVSKMEKDSDEEESDMISEQPRTPIAALQASTHDKVNNFCINQQQIEHSQKLRQQFKKDLVNDKNILIENSWQDLSSEIPALSEKCCNYQPLFDFEYEVTSDYQALNLIYDFFQNTQTTNDSPAITTLSLLPDPFPLLKTYHPLNDRDIHKSLILNTVLVYATYFLGLTQQSPQFLTLANYGKENSGYQIQFIGELKRPIVLPKIVSLNEIISKEEVQDITQVLMSYNLQQFAELHCQYLQSGVVNFGQVIRGKPSLNSFSFEMNQSSGPTLTETQQNIVSFGLNRKVFTKTGVQLLAVNPARLAKLGGRNVVLLQVNLEKAVDESDVFDFVGMKLIPNSLLYYSLSGGLNLNLSVIASGRLTLLNEQMGTSIISKGVFHFEYIVKLSDQETLTTSVEIVRIQGDFEAFLSYDLFGQNCLVNNVSYCPVIKQIEEIFCALAAFRCNMAGYEAVSESKLLPVDKYHAITVSQQINSKEVVKLSCFPELIDCLADFQRYCPSHAQFFEQTVIE